MARKREQREQRVVSAKRRIKEHEVGGAFTSLTMPEGISLFAVKKAGTYRIDIIPYTVGKGNPFADEGELHYERTYYVHRGIGPDNASYVCLNKTFKKPCPICEYRAQLMKDPGADEEEVKSLAPKERQLWNVLDHADRDKGVQVWDQSYFLFGKQLDDKIRNADEEDSYDTFADPGKGLTLKLGVVEEKGGGYTFFKVSDIEFKPRKAPLDDELLESAACLDELLKEVSYDELKKIFLQTGEDKDDESDDDEEPKKKAPAKKAAKKPEPEDDDEEEEGDEPPPKKAPAKSKGKWKVGDYVLYEGADGECECEIMKVSADGTSLTLEDEDGVVYRAVSPDDVAPVDEDDDEPAPKKTPAKGKPAAKGKAKKPEPEEDNDEEDNDEEDNDEEDNDEEDNDEEEEPAPKKAVKKRK